MSIAEWIRTLIARNLNQGGRGRIERSSVMMHVFEFATKSDLDGCYMEFGTFQGASFIRAYHAYMFWLSKARTYNWKLQRNMMYAFDAFEGLPELSSADQQEHYTVFNKGQYACSETQFLETLENEGVDVSLVQIVKGYFEHSLNDEAKQRIASKAAVIHIDVDLYSSCVPVLEFVTEFLQDGTVLLFDDYYCYRGNPHYGEQRAFTEWLHRHMEWSAQEYLTYGWAGKGFIVNSTETPSDAERT